MSVTGTTSEIRTPASPVEPASPIRAPLGSISGVALVAGFAVLAGFLIPRGPVTTLEALVAMGAALVVGVGAGFLMPGRWSMLIAPVTFIVVFELTRVGTSGPTVDLPSLTSFLGILAFVLGRLVPGVLILVPMVLGSAIGSGLARRVDSGTTGIGPGGFVVLGVVALLIGVLAWSLARPATTAQILDGGPNSIAELTTVEIGGHEQSIMIRGRDMGFPVLLYLAGGPGGTDLGALRMDAGLEQHFVVAAWEQRGAGKSYGALDPTDTMTLEGMVDDTIEVTNYLRDRFGKSKIYLVGQSWGSTLGVLAVQQAPELYHALVGVGQMVSQRETDRAHWEDTLLWAEATGNTDLANTLRSNGPPPYDDVALYEPVVSYEHDWNSYPQFDPNNEMPAILFVPEYTLMDRINAFRGFLDTNAVLYPQLQEIDFREDVTELAVPYLMVLGEHETRGRADLAQEWFAGLEAPAKQSVVFEGAGHRPNFDDPARFADLMRGFAADNRG